MLVIQADMLFDGEQLLTNQTVYVEDKQIAKIVPGNQGEIPENAKVIRTTGCLLPGLIDCHVHICSPGAADHRKFANDPAALLTLRATKHARETLQAGFTTVRNCGSAYDIDIVLRNAIKDQLVTGPRLVASGRCIAMTGGHGHQMAIEADGPWEVAKAVRQLIKEGADVIKLMSTGGVLTEGVEPGSPELTKEELQKAVEVAHNAGKLTATHAQGTTGILNAVQAGIDSIEHGIFLTEKVVEEMVKHKTALVPTLAAPHNILANGVAGGIPSYAVEKTKLIAKSHTKSFKLALDAGVLIGLGTDAGTPFNYHGRSSKELELMVDAGMTPLQALQAATSNAAKIVGHQQVGRIKPGFLADMVILNQDPTKDIRAFQDIDNITHVIKEGEEVKKQV